MVAVCGTTGSCWHYFIVSLGALGDPRANDRSVSVYVCVFFFYLISNANVCMEMGNRVCAHQLPRIVRTVTKMRCRRRLGGRDDGIRAWSHMRVDVCDLICVGETRVCDG